MTSKNTCGNEYEGHICTHPKGHSGMHMSDAGKYAWSDEAKDAARYRFIRDEMYLHSTNCAEDYAMLAFLHGAAFDAVVDSEMRKDGK